MSLEKAEVLKKLAVTAYILLEKADFEIKKECGESMADRITFKDEDLAKFSMELAFAELIVAMEKAIATGLVDGNFEIKKECGESMADRITFKDEDLAKFSMELAFAELIVAMEKAIATGLVDGNRLQECESAVRGSLDSNALTDDLNNVPLEHFSK